MTYDDYTGDSICLYCESCERFEAYAVWGNEDGFYLVDSSGDGNPTEDSVTMDEMTEMQKNWAAYYREVARTGDDYLGQLCIGTPGPKEERWQVAVKPSIAGVVVIGVRRNRRGPWINARKAPQHVQEFLCLEGDFRVAVIEPTSHRNGKTPEWPGMDGLRKATADDPNITWGKHGTRFHFSRNVPWLDAKITGPERSASITAVKRAARKCLRLQKERSAQP